MTSVPSREGGMADARGVEKKTLDVSSPGGLVLSLFGLMISVTVEVSYRAAELMQPCV